MIYRYAYPEMFEGMEKPDFKKYSGNIVLWGAGKMGTVVAHRLRQLGIEFMAFVDNNPDKHGIVFCGHKVISPTELLSNFPESIIIMTTVLRSELVEQLEKYTTPVFDAWSLLLEFDWKHYDYMNELYMERMVDYYFLTIGRELRLKRKHFVHRLVVNITNRCTLRCEECSAYIPYFENHCDYSQKSIIIDSMNVMDTIGHFKELALFGGEPFMHKELAEILRFFRNVKSFDVLSVFANGTILPDKELLEAIKKESRMLVRVSDYGKLSTKREALVKLLTDNAIKHEVIDYKTWYRNAEIRVFNETEKERRSKFSCCMNACFPCISNGKLFLCKVCMSLCELDVFPEADNYLDLTVLRDSDREMRNETIRRYILRMDSDDYIDACKYCSGKASAHYLDMSPVAEQAKGLLKIDKISV